ncbi:MAG: purine-nucleoside phosphorylase [Ginsengibacter sp.]
MMNTYLKEINDTAEFLKEKGFTSAKTAIILGTGLGSFLTKLKVKVSVPYTEIPNFPQATVEFHKGQLVLGELQGIKVIVMQGRFHYYEGYTMQQITFPVRVMKALGVGQILLSNAAGGINKNYKKGDLVLIEDHINLQPDNPLKGLNDPEMGNRFVDMSDPYSLSMNKKLKEAALSNSIQLKSGIYASVMGPNLETKAEYRYLGRIGADLVGMSTVPEVIVANHVGCQCAAISVITDECDPDNLKPVDISEIIKVAGEADKSLSEVFATFLAS